MINVVFNIKMERPLILIFLFLTQLLIAQELSKEELLALSFEEIEALENKLYNAEDRGYINKIIDAHIIKAKLLNDTTRLADAYVWKTWEVGVEEGVQYSDSAIALTKSSPGSKYPGEAYYYKGSFLYQNNRPEESLLEFIEAYKFAAEFDNHELTVDCLSAIAALKREYGHKDQALLLFKKALVHLNKHKESFPKSQFEQMLAMDNLARGFAEVKEYDSARVYARKGLGLALDLDNNEMYARLNILNAQIDYYDKNYLKSRDSLLKYIIQIDDYEKPDAFYYLGMIQGMFNSPEDKQMFFKKIDSILSVQDYPIMDNVKDVYQYLLENAMRSRNDSLQASYLRRLVYYDSLIDHTQNSINKTALADFDLPMQKQEKFALQAELKKKQKWIIVAYFLSGLFLIGISALYIRYLQTKKKINRILKNKAQPEVRLHTENGSNTLQIEEPTLNDILEKLETWENNLGFLDKEMDQTLLSKELGSNNTYVSKIINHYKGQNFPNYLKDLKITYAINYLKENPGMIKEKSTVQIAEHFGFNSIDVFKRAFKQKTGVTPSVFFKRLIKGNL